MNARTSAFLSTIWGMSALKKCVRYECDECDVGTLGAQNALISHVGVQYERHRSAIVLQYERSESDMNALTLKARWACVSISKNNRLLLK